MNIKPNTISKLSDEKLDQIMMRKFGINKNLKHYGHIFWYIFGVFCILLGLFQLLNLAAGKVSAGDVASTILLGVVLVVLNQNSLIVSEYMRRTRAKLLEKNPEPSP